MPDESPSPSPHNSGTARGWALIHGFMGHPDDWNALRSALMLGPRHHAMHALELTVHHVSDQQLAHWDMASEVDSLATYLRDLVAGSEGLIGYSMGGRLALQLAISHPDQVSALILESANPGIADPAERRARYDADMRLADRIEALAEQPDAVDAFLREWYQQPVFAALADQPQLLERLIDHRRRRADPASWARQLRAFTIGRQADLWPALATLDIPILAIAGQRDPKYAAIAQRIADTAPHAHALIIPDAGHIVHLEAESAYHHATEQFITSLPQ